MTDYDFLAGTSNGSMPLVSVVIPTFNRKRLLAEAVESCLNQSYENIEVIIVDDGSTDGTDAVISTNLAGSWGEGVSYFRQGNAGASAARNQGLELASGKYVQFLDSDDVLFRDKLALQVRQLETAAANLQICSCFGRIGPLTQELAQTRRIGIQCTTSAEYMRKMSTRVIHGMSTPAPLWNRSFLIGRPGWRADISLGDDLEYYMRLLADTKNVGFIAQDLFLVREHDGPHLSDAGNNRAQTISAFLTHQSVVNTVRDAGLWDADVQAGVFRKARTLYANILQCGTKLDVFEFEAWLAMLQKNSHPDFILAFLVLLRRIIGSTLIIKSHVFYLKIKVFLKTN